MGVPSSMEKRSGKKREFGSIRSRMFHPEHDDLGVRAEGCRVRKGGKGKKILRIGNSQRKEGRKTNDEAETQSKRQTANGKLVATNTEKKIDPCSMRCNTKKILVNARWSKGKL